MFYSMYFILYSQYKNIWFENNPKPQEFHHAPGSEIPESTTDYWLIDIQYSNSDFIFLKKYM